ncbi:MAG: radical SAM protein [Firmicutes bacterium]|nr:radical SAM protein [Bacillota bacterium]
MTLPETMQRCAADLALRPLLRFIEKKPGPNLVKLMGIVDFASKRTFPRKTIEAFKAGALDDENVWKRMAVGVLRDVDRDALRRLLLSLGLGIANGTRLVRRNREKYGCNIPFQILFDPTSACNLHCRGCWAGEYHKHENLSFEEMDGIAAQAKKLGTRVFMLTGGEPLIRKKDVLRVAARHRECTFLIYTNATLIDEELARATKKLGNVVFAVSLEGFEQSNDARRGEGAYARSMRAIDLLKKERCLFGISVCYTSENLETVTSDAFLDEMIARGVKFGFYFHYMPLGKGAAPELMPTPAQRERLYQWLRETRGAKTGKPMFIMDFQNDAEYVGGCIGGGRNYFHINAAGDMEPCVFIHYSDSNVREHTLLEALQRPLFRAFYKGQPFNRNHLRPCPMLENPELLRGIVGGAGAKSTDLAAPEDVDALCAKCERYAAAWKPAAERIWEGNRHPKPKTQYYGE